MILETTEKDGELILRIDPALQELLGLKPGARLEVTTDGERVILSPVVMEGATHKERLRKALAEVNERYGNALRNLAK